MIKRLIICLSALLLLLGGCADKNNEPETQTACQITFDEVAALQPGQSAQIEVGPELREDFFKLARLEDWYHIPEFTTPEDLPTDPLAYWFMLLAEGRTGWDKYGNLTGPSPWVHRGYLYSPDYNYYFDGQDYYFTCVEGALAPLSGWQLDALQAANADSRIVYTAEVRLYCLYEYGYAAYDEDVSFEENMSRYAQSVNGRTENKPVYEAYGRQMIQNEITLDEAARQMVIAGDTEGFPWRERLRVQFYIDEQIGEPFYLQVESLPLEE